MAHPHTPQPEPLSKTPSFQRLVIISTFFERWGKILGTIVALLAVIGGVSGIAASLLETKAHAQQATADQTSALERAKEGCAENLRTALGKTNEHLTSLNLSVLSLQKDVAEQASDSAAQLLLLQRLADKLGVIPVLVPPPDLTGPPAPPQARR